MTATITVVGSLNMDLVIKAPVIPAPGETVLSPHALEHFPGGKGANQAVAAANLGAAVRMVGKVGDDDFANQLFASMAAIDMSGVIRDRNVATGIALIVVDDAGENSIVVASGANAKIHVTEIQKDVLSSADVVLLQLEIPLETVTYVAQVAKASGVPVILNPAPAQRLPDELLQNVDILTPNRIEAAMIAQRKVETIDDCIAAAKVLIAKGPQAIVFTLGSDGALLVTTEHHVHVKPYRVDVVDTTAAGDAFNGGLAVAIAEGHPLENAVQFANATGALATTQAGAQPSLPTLQAVRNLQQTQQG